MIAAPSVSSLFEGAPELDPEIIPCIASAASEAPTLATQGTADFGAFLGREKQGYTGTHGQSDGDPGGKYCQGPVVVGLALGAAGRWSWLCPYLP